MSAGGADETRESLTLTGVLRALAAGGVDFVVCGGVACIMHGVKRVTNDVDLCVKLNDENLQRIVELARRLHLRPRIPEPLEALLDQRKRREWIESKGAKVFTLTSAENPLQIDVFLEYPIPFDELKQRANVMRAGDVSLRVSSKADLIEAKRQVQPIRMVDQRDIADLQELIERERQAGR